jgi:hypothetical protein
MRPAHIKGGNFNHFARLDTNVPDTYTFPFAFAAENEAVETIKSQALKDR